ncbi:hypothetical protein DEO72_LG6g1563 [Vigna unguiculata]|uniref:Uncharacterized protein n=1 Tax=Vigna unguiculata TaxID=3917 RepID=A0A4D6LDX6_VIGUN|nr:hypothetical protein DEO72_LG3g1243 [Vigna unguiculata]QCD96853.1 hypothetical protein DEO72_LG6g1563 [Vigna unguiculata]
MAAAAVISSPATTNSNAIFFSRPISPATAPPSRLSHRRPPSRRHFLLPASVQPRPPHQIYGLRTRPATTASATCASSRNSSYAATTMPFHEGCHVIIFISQNPNPNFLLSFHPPWQPPPSSPFTATANSSSSRAICTAAAAEELRRSATSRATPSRLSHRRPPSRRHFLLPASVQPRPPHQIYGLRTRPATIASATCASSRNSSYAATTMPFHLLRSATIIAITVRASVATSRTQPPPHHAATMNENEPRQPPFSHQQRTPSTRTSSVHKPPPPRLRRRRRRSSRAVIHKPP